MTTDPLLQNVELLTVAGLRLRERRQHQVPDWRNTVGISALLEAARVLPRRDPWDLPDLDGGGLSGLLEEARRRHKEVDDGA